MSYQFLVQLPSHLEKAYEAGDISITGGVARWATGRPEIAAHLESVTPTLMEGGLMAANPPMAMAIEAGGLFKGIADTAKLNKIIQLTQSIQTLSAVNLAVSGVSLGVSVVGFAMVLHKLHRLDKRLQSVAVKLDALNRNETIKLVSRVKERIKHSITLVRQLEDLGWSAPLDTEMVKQLDSIEVLLAEVISRYLDREDINISLELAQYLYCAYASLLKAYLTGRYRQKQSLIHAGQRLKTLAGFAQQLTSPDMLDDL